MEEQTTEVVTLSVAVLGNGPHIAVLAEQVKDLKDTVNILISQIQMLRSELKK
jgi:ubiquinone biosynthesis protein UbiJ